jgi:hypothetical protein
VDLTESVAAPCLQECQDSASVEWEITKHCHRKENEMLPCSEHLILQHSDHLKILFSNSTAIVSSFVHHEESSCFRLLFLSFLFHRYFVISPSIYAFLIVLSSLIA